MDRIESSGLKPAPVFISDTRPTADAAALSRDPRPEIPLPVAQPVITSPTSASQGASVSRSLMLARGIEPADTTRAIAPAEDVNRTLKPYGIRMLPEGQEAASQPQVKDSRQ